jgi:hypothetical protein
MQNYLINKFVLIKIKINFSLFVGIVGIDCTKIGDESGVKPTMGLVSGVMALLSGILIGVAVSWYAGNVYRTYDDNIAQSQPGNQYVYGPCLSIGKHFYSTVQLMINGEWYFFNIIIKKGKISNNCPPISVRLINKREFYFIMKDNVFVALNYIRENY